MICPSCAHKIHELTDEVVAAHEGSTTDCPYCETLLIIKGGRLLEFHPYLSAETGGTWPATGANTGFIEIK